MEGNSKLGRLLLKGKAKKKGKEEKKKGKRRIFLSGTDLGFGR